MTVTLEEAALQLEVLVREATHGEEITITDGRRAVAKIVALPKPKARFGSAKGSVWMAPDFDEPLDDFKDYM